MQNTLPDGTSPAATSSSQRRAHIQSGNQILDAIIRNSSDWSAAGLNSLSFKIGQVASALDLSISSARARISDAAHRHGCEQRFGTPATIDAGLEAGWLTPELPASNDNVIPPLPVFRASDLAGRSASEREFIVSPWIPANTVSSLSGAGGGGKSTLALQLMVATALGSVWCGLPVAKGPTLYLGAEDEIDDLHHRLVRIAKHCGSTLEDLRDMHLVPLVDRDPALALPVRGTMRETTTFQQLRELALEIRPKLIVLDAAADLFAGDEIDRKQVREFIAMLRRLAIEVGTAILLLSHPSVAGIQTGSGFSGSTAWVNSVRSHLYLDTPGGDNADLNVRRLTLKKANYAPSGGELMLRWTDGLLLTDTGPDPAADSLINGAIDSLFVELLTLFSEQGQPLGAAPGSNYAPSIMARHPRAKGFNKKQLAASMQRLLDARAVKIETFGPASRGRRRLVMVAGPDITVAAANLPGE